MEITFRPLLRPTRPHWPAWWRAPTAARQASWTTEAGLIDGQRIDAAEALDKISAPGSMVLVVSDDAGATGSPAPPGGSPWGPRPRRCAG